MLTGCSKWEKEVPVWTYFPPSPPSFPSVPPFPHPARGLGERCPAANACV